MMTSTIGGDMAAGDDDEAAFTTQTVHSSDLAYNLTSTQAAEVNVCALVTPQFMARLEQFNDPFLREPNTRVFVTAIYTTVACIGAIGNLFVIAAVIRNPLMRTPRNYFIINLALSDLLMCALTVPFTLYYVLNTFWGLGSTACRIVASAQGVNIFVSAMSITAIGLDRYWVILFPTKTQQQRLVVMICFTFIWIVSFLLAFPLFYATDVQFPRGFEGFAQCGVHRLVCSEDWEQMVFDKRVYTISSTAFQYVLPLTMLTFVYARIIWRLENRMAFRTRAMVNTPQLEHSTMGSTNVNVTASNSRLHNRRRSLEVRQRRMNLLLICVVAFFAFCWLPLNLYNALLSFEFVGYNVVAFSSCHVFGMTSACANPVLYGVFNENFRQEFIAILTYLRIVPIVRYLRKMFVARRRAATSAASGGGNNGGQSPNDGENNGIGPGGGYPGGHRGGSAGGHHRTSGGGGLRASSFKKNKTSQQGGGGSNGRRNSHKSNRLAPDDGFQKLLDTSPAVTLNGSCYQNLSSAATTANWTSSPPTVHVTEDDGDLLDGGLGGGGNGVGKTGLMTSSVESVLERNSSSILVSPAKKKLDIENSTLEENTPLFADSSCVGRSSDGDGDGEGDIDSDQPHFQHHPRLPDTYVLTTDL